MNAEVAALYRNQDVVAETESSPTGRRTGQRMITPSGSSLDDQNSEQGPERHRDIFDAALALHRDEVMQYLRKRLGDQETAADLTQEALSRMMRYRDSGEVDDHRLMLFRIANNLILEHHRTRQRHHAGAHYSLEDTGPLHSQEPPVEVTIDARQAINTLLKRTIAQLPTKCRLAFMLSRFDGMSYPQIADQMGTSVKMVEKHITKALLACRAAVGDRDF